MTAKSLAYAVRTAGPHGMPIRITDRSNGMNTKGRLEIENFLRFWHKKGLTLGRREIDAWILDVDVFGHTVIEIPANESATGNPVWHTVSPEHLT
jgi:hypothetical protein